MNLPIDNNRTDNRRRRPGRGCDFAANQRSVLIALRLRAGEILTTKKLSADYGIHRSTAYRDLCRLSQLREFPLTEESGRWYLIRNVAPDATTA